MVDPSHAELKLLLTKTVLQFCRQKCDFTAELRIHGTVCVTSGSNSILVTQLSEVVQFANDIKAPTHEESVSPGNLYGNSKHSTPSPVGDQKNRERKVRKRKQPPLPPLQPGTPAAQKLARRETDGADETELGVVKIEPDDETPSPPEDSTLNESCDPEVSGFLGFGEDVIGSQDGMLNTDDLVPGSSEYAFNQAEYIAAMNREGAALGAPSSLGEPPDNHTNSAQGNRTKDINHLQFIEKKGADKYRCTMCDKEYNNRGSMYRHIDKHLGRSFTCEYCDATFESHSGWTRHIRNIHAQHMNFSCDKCTKKFYQRNALDQHYTRIHQVKEPKVEGPT